MIPLFQVHMPRGVTHELRKTLFSGYIAEGPRVAEFEKAFGDWLGTPNVLAVSSGTAALHLALELANVRGGEVISTPLTAEPTNLAILYAGATPVWADIDPRNGNISAESIRACVTKNTRAIMVVHYGGIPVALNAVRQVAEAHGLPVIEDAAHALGAGYQQKKIGLHSEYVCFSFQAIKHMPMGDGGALVLKHAAQLERARRLRWFGMDRQTERTKLDIKELGWKYNLNDIAATIGLAQLRDIDDVIAKHKRNGAWYDRALFDMPDLQTLTWDVDADPSYWFYTIVTDRWAELQGKLTEAGIASGRVHKRNDVHSLFLSSKVYLPNLEWFYPRMLHIPCGWWIGRKEREHISNTIRGAMQ